MSSRPPPRRTPRPPPPQGSAKVPAISISGLTLKRVIWTGAFAAVTVVGAIYGAGLKSQQEFKAEKRQIIQESPEQRIRALEHRRAQLLMARLPLERKLEKVRRRVEEEDRGSSSGGSLA
ncbi:hypothetical protein GGR57DRAFT_453442 [Xylariaceae sp. FL1272]|nr:hypothetical protein GGR57DRAFT_453442 [Xylariaceae sp. FL1272]